MTSTPDTGSKTVGAGKSRWMRAARISAVLAVWVSVWHDYQRGPDGFFFTSRGLMLLVGSFFLGTLLIWALNYFIFDRWDRTVRHDD